MTRVFIAITVSMLVAYPAFATSFWLSPYGTVAGSTQPTSLSEIPTLYNFDSQSDGSVYIWAKTDAAKTLKNWSLRVESTDVNVLSFTNSTVYNPELFTSNDFRWEYTTEPTSSSEISDDFMGFTLSSDPSNLGRGIGPSTPTDDPYYFGPNDGSGSWLLAKLDYTIANSSSGMADMFLQIGLLGINNVGETSLQTSVLFGHTGDTPFADAGSSNRQTNGFNQVDAKVQIADADFDNDTLVDGADFLTWQRNSGTSSPLNSKGNATYLDDTDVNEIDLDAWEFQYGMTIPVGGSLAGLSVPEPTTAALLCLAFSVLFTRSRRRIV